MYDTSNPSSSASAPAYANASPVSVTYTTSDAGPAGVKEVELWVKGPGDAAYALVATDATPASPSFSYALAQGEGSYRFYTRARDNAGNAEAAPASEDALTVYDTSNPSSSASAPAYTNSSPVTVTYTSSDSGPSGVKEVELWVKRPGDAAYALVATDATPASPSFSYTPSAGEGSYRFYTRARDETGHT